MAPSQFVLDPIPWEGTRKTVEKAEWGKTQNQFPTTPWKSPTAIPTIPPSPRRLPRWLTERNPGGWLIRSCDQTSRNSGCPDWHRADPVNACQQAIRCTLCSVCRPCKGCMAATSVPPAETLVGRCLLLLLSSPFLLV